MPYINYIDYPDILKQSISHCVDCRDNFQKEMIFTCAFHREVINDHNRKFNFPYYVDILNIQGLIFKKSKIINKKLTLAQVIEMVLLNPNQLESMLFNIDKER